jgi:hypothetical protein
MVLKEAEEVVEAGEGEEDLNQWSAQRLGLFLARKAYDHGAQKLL